MRALKWFIVQGIAATLLYLWIVHDMLGPLRLFIFWAWLEVVGSVCLCYNTEKVDELRKKGRSVHRYISTSVDMAFIGVLVWHSAEWTAIAYLLSTICETYIFGGKDQNNERTADSI